MQLQAQLAIRVAIASAALLLGATLGPGASSPAQGATGKARGCHAWPAVFRPVLSIPGEGTVLVALPTYLPTFSHRVYAHANVLQPPLTYDAALSTRPGTGWPVPRATTLLAVHGAAGKHGRFSGQPAVVAGGKHLTLIATARNRSAVWYDRAANATYTVTMPRAARPTLLRIASSLVTGALRAAPITAGPSSTGFNACP